MASLSSFTGPWLDIDSQSQALISNYRQTHDLGVRNEVVTINEPVVRSIAVHLVRKLPSSIDLGDLVSSGKVALFPCIENYDPERNTSFSGFSYLRVKGGMLDELRALDPQSRGYRKLRRHYLSLTSKLGREATKEEVQLEANRPMSDRMWREISSPEESLNVLPLFSEAGAPIDLEDPSAIDPQRSLLQVERIALVREVIARLTATERAVIKLYIYEDFTLAEIARLLGMCESRASQYLTRAKIKIYKSLRGKVDVKFS